MTLSIIRLVVDESASMLSCAAATISGINEYVKGQAALPGECWISLTTFHADWQDNNAPSITHTPLVKAQNFPKLTEENYKPNGNTPLLDAIGSAAASLDESLAKQITKPDQILFVIMTDGLENASRELELKDVTDLISSKSKAEPTPWQVLFLGANIDTFGEAHKFGGVQLASNALNYTATPDGVTKAFASLNTGTAAYRTRGVAVQQDFFNGEDSIKPTTGSST